MNSKDKTFVKNKFREILENFPKNASESIIQIEKLGIDENDIRKVLWEMTAAGEIYFTPGFKSIYLRKNA